MLDSKLVYKTLKKIPGIADAYEEGATPNNQQLKNPYIIYNTASVETSNSLGRSYIYQERFKLTVVSTTIFPDIHQYIIEELNGKLDIMFINDGMRHAVYTIASELLPVEEDAIVQGGH